MRRVTWILAMVVSVVLVAAGCGKKDAGQVVKDLDHVISKLDSYEGAGKMTLHTGQQPQEYNVEVWYQTPHYYRISLTNAEKDITQIVLRNDEGVFVLTPHLNKMFRFQSDWPENSGQVYLYQSLVQSIVMDQDRQFAVENDSYVFDVMANYQNALLSRQKIWLSKKNYAPQRVAVSDENNNVMVSVDFTHFEFGKKFEKDSFDMQRNMTSSSLQSLPATAPAGDGTAKGAANATPVSGGTAKGGAGAQPLQQANGGTGTNKAAGQNGTGAYAASANGGKTASQAQSLAVIVPEYTPKGVKQQDIKEVKLGEDQAVLLRYSGTYNYTLVESMPVAKTVTSLSGTILDLGYTLGIVTGDEKGLKTLTWTYDGVEFRLSTADLPDTELIRIAQSVQGQIGK